MSNLFKNAPITAKGDLKKTVSGMLPIELTEFLYLVALDKNKPISNLIQEMVERFKHEHEKEAYTLSELIEQTAKRAYDSFALSKNTNINKYLEDLSIEFSNRPVSLQTIDQIKKNVKKMYDDSKK